MSHSNPATPATPRFSPYPPSALRTALFGQTVLSTPRSVSLPRRPEPPVVRPASVSAFGPTRSVPRPANATTAATATKSQNPFEKLSASDFNAFVDQLRSTVHDALDPEAERKRKRQEREQRRAAATDRTRPRVVDPNHEPERDRQSDGLVKSAREQDDDVFGKVQPVHRVEYDQRGNVGGDDDDDGYAGTDSARSRGSEPIPTRGSQTVEIVLLDSDDDDNDVGEDEQRTTEARTVSDRAALERQDSVVNSVVGSVEDDYSERDEEDDQDDDGEEGEESEIGDDAGRVSDGTEDLQATSSRSPTPNSLASLSPRKRPASTSFPSRPVHDAPRAARVENDDRTLAPDHVTSSPDPEPRRARASPRRETRTRRSPLFRPRNDGSSASELSVPPEDFVDHDVIDDDDDVLDREREYYSQDEDGDGSPDERWDPSTHAGPDHDVSGRRANEDDDDGNYDDGEEEEKEEDAGAIEVDEADDDDDDDDVEDEGQPGPSQRVKRDVFGRPIRYMEEEDDETSATVAAAGVGVEFETGLEEEQGFGEDEQQDYQEFEQPAEPGYGFRLEDLVHESAQEHSRIVEGEEQEEGDDEEEDEENDVDEEEDERAKNLGTMELNSSDDDDDDDDDDGTLIRDAPAAGQAGSEEGVNGPEPGVSAANNASTPPEPLALDSTTRDLLSTVIRESELPLPDRDISVNDRGPSGSNGVVADSILSVVSSTSDDLSRPEQSVPVPLVVPDSIEPVFFDAPEPCASTAAITFEDDDVATTAAPEELLDVDQVRALESDRLPFLQEAAAPVSQSRTGAAAFPGYADDDDDDDDEQARTDEVGIGLDVDERDEAVRREAGVQVGDESSQHAEQDRDEGPEEEPRERVGSTPGEEGEEGEEGEYFGEGVPGDEVVPGREVDSEDDFDISSDKRAVYSEEDSEDLGPRIPYEAKGKGRALPSPSVDSDDPSRFALSEDEAEYSSSVSDAEDTWRPDLLLQYDLNGLERLMRVLSSQLRESRSERLQLAILQQLDDVQEIYTAKGGELIDEDDEEDESMEGDRASRHESAGFPVDVARDDTNEDSPPSPDYSAFQPPSPPSEGDNLDESDRRAQDQVLAIASQLVDLQSSSNPFPSLRIGAPPVADRPPEATLSSHFRRQNVAQPKLDDPVNLPPGPATTTHVDAPIESAQRDDELEIERIAVDERDPIEMQTGEAESVNVEVKLQTDRVDLAQSNRDTGGLTVVDDDEGPRSTNVSESSSNETVEQEEEAGPNNVSADVFDSSSLPVDEPAGFPKRESPTAENTRKLAQSAIAETATLATSADDVPDVMKSLEAPEVEPSVSSIAEPTLMADTLAGSPFVPLPASATASLARTVAGPDLSRFSSHFRYEPNGPPPPLDAPLNLAAPPSFVTNVDEPIERPQRDAELEPEIQVSNENEDGPELHRLSEMVDLSRRDEAAEAEDFEQPRLHTDALLIIDDDELAVPLRPADEGMDRIQEQPPNCPPVPHRSRVGVTPPPSSAAVATTPSIVEGTAPPRNLALTLSTPPRSPSPSSAVDQTPASTREIDRATRDESLAPDEIRFDDQAENPQPLASDSSSDDDDDEDDANDEASDAEVANELLSPHKRLGGVLGFSGRAEEFGETIVMNSDSDDEDDELAGRSASPGCDDDDGDDDEGTPARTAEEIDLETVKMALRRQNEALERVEAEEQERDDSRHVSEAPSSEPISYASSDEGEEEAEMGGSVASGSGHLIFNDEDSQTRSPQDEDAHGSFGGEEVDENASTSRDAPSSILQIHGVLEPGEWDPSHPIEFGPPELASARIDNEAALLARDDVASHESDLPVAVIVEMDQATDPLEPDVPPPSDDAITQDVLESVAEAIAASTEPAQGRPFLEVEAEVIEDALNSDSTGASEPDEEDSERSPADKGARDATNDVSDVTAPDVSDQEDKISATQTSTRRSPRRATATLPGEPLAIDNPSPLASDSRLLTSPMRRSSRLSSLGPASKAAETIVSSTSQPQKTKRPRTSYENGAAAPEPGSPEKKTRRSGHSTKLREEVTENEEPAPIAGASRAGLRIHHHHHAPNHALTSSTTTSKSRQFEPPLTRSRCHFTRLRLSSINEDSPPYEFLVPACALTSVIATETMARHNVENLGPVDESTHCRGVALGGRGFDADAAKVMRDRARDAVVVVPDADVLDVVRRIVGTEMFDEGEVEVLPRHEGGHEDEDETRESSEVAKDGTGNAVAAREEHREERTGEENDDASRGKKRSNKEDPGARETKDKKRRS